LDRNSPKPKCYLVEDIRELWHYLAEPHESGHFKAVEPSILIFDGPFPDITEPREMRGKTAQPLQRVEQISTKLLQSLTVQILLDVLHFLHILTRNYPVNFSVDFPVFNLL